MNNHAPPSARDLRTEILDDLEPVTPLAVPSRRALMLVPLGIAIVVSAPLLSGGRGDLVASSPLITWGLTALQSLAGLWLLALGFREAVPGRTVSAQALVLAGVVTLLLVGTITLLTNGASATVVPAGREWEYWMECVVGPMTVGAPFMVLAALMAARAFPVRPAIAGALCGLSAGVLSDAGWRLTCWISEPGHIVGSHGLAIVGLAVLGSAVAGLADMPRWVRLRRRPKSG
jgi:hypothetical protein